ncbi:MAG TPA: energy transducer TonB [Methylomirabilota bacterium]|jgi:TonB family protein
MTTATLTVRMDGAAAPGPALGRAKLPLGTIALSALLHAVVIGGLLVVGMVWRTHQPKMYVVNLVPNLAAVGTPEGRPTPAPAPPVPTPPAPVTPAPVAPPAPPRPPTPLPEREPVKAPAALPDRREMPTRSSGLPDRTLQARAPALPRPDQKELPPVADSAPRPSSLPPPSPAPTTTPTPRRDAAVAPPSPVGRPSGSALGTGALTLNAGDFPFAWYLQQLQKKISEQWKPPANATAGQRAVVVFEIRRDGQLASVSVETRSGDFLYDQAALRAVSDATPFPELPKDYAQSVLRVHLGFNFTDNRG